MAMIMANPPIPETPLPEPAKEMWVEVFRAHKQRDGGGRVIREWTEKDLDTIASKYNPQKHEAPVVIGHPKENAPAWGWVKGLKRAKRTLLAHLKVVPEFADIVNREFYKKRSISIYPDLSLRHVGFLGAVPPAVKGLSDFKFEEENEFITIEFNENGGNEMDEKEKELQDLKATMLQFMEQAKAKTKDKEIADLKAKEATSEFAEKAKQNEEEMQALRAQVENLRKEKREKEHSDFCEKLGAKLAPTDRKDMVDFLEILNGVGAYDFAEGGNKPAIEKFKNFCEKNLKEQISFKEIATKQRAGSGTVKKTVAEKNMSIPVNEEEQALVEKADEFAEKNNVSFEVAVEAIRRESNE